MLVKESTHQADIWINIVERIEYNYLCMPCISILALYNTTSENSITNPTHFRYKTELILL